MVQRNRQLSFGFLHSLDWSLRRASPAERAKLLDRLRSRLGIPPQARSSPELLRRLDEVTLANLRACPLLAAILLRLRSATIEFVGFELEDEPPLAWAARQLAKALGDVPAPYRRWIRGCFVHGNLSSRPAHPLLLKYLSDPRPRVRQAAAEILQESSVKPAPLMPEVRTFASDSVEAVRRLAHRWIHDLVLEFLPTLIPKPSGGKPADQGPGAWALVSHAKLLVETIPALASVSPSSDLRMDPLPELLGHIRKACTAIVPRLVKEVGSRDRRISDRAAASLLANWRTLRTEGKRLVRYSRSRIPHVRANAASVLPLSGASRQDNMALLRRLLSDPVPEVSLAAAGVLARHYTLDAADAGILAKRLPQWDLASATCGARLLAEAGQESESARRWLLRGLHHKDPDTRLMAVLGFGSLRSVERSTLMELFRALNDRDINVRTYALQALSSMVPSIRRDEAEIRRLIQTTSPGGWNRAPSSAVRRELKRWSPYTLASSLRVP